MDENWNVDCEMPLQLGEAAPPPGQLPLSRPTDQKAISVMPLLLAHEVSDVAFARVKVSPAQSLTPIMGVMPSWVLAKPLAFNQLRAACAPEIAAAYMSETEWP